MRRKEKQNIKLKNLDCDRIAESLIVLFFFNLSSKLIYITSFYEKKSSSVSTFFVVQPIAVRMFSSGLKKTLSNCVS